MKLLLLLFALFFSLANSALAQGDRPMVTTPAEAKFVGLPVLPACATFAVEKGDPMNGPSILLIKAKSGCVIPWHWHTATEQLMFVSGTGKIEMQDSRAHKLNKGDFALLPAKHHHQFTCSSSCLFFNVIDGAFDIHYIDKSGKEIPPGEALKNSRKRQTSSNIRNFENSESRFATPAMGFYSRLVVAY
jgi:quercetin dioxygenase-like cupin family protein